MPSDRSKNLRVWITGAVIGLFFLGLFVIAYQIGYDRGENNIAGKTPASATKGGATGASGGAATGAGKDAFAGTCGSCHALAAASTKGAVGPNLDTLKPDKNRVLNAITKGGTGSGAMPKGLLTGDEADQVAAFVAGNAGS